MLHVSVECPVRRERERVGQVVVAACGWFDGFSFGAVFGFGFGLFLFVFWGTGRVVISLSVIHSTFSFQLLFFPFFFLPQFFFFF